MILSWHMSQTSQFPSFQFGLSTLFNRKKALEILFQYQGSSSTLYLKYILPLACFPSFIFFLTLFFIQTGDAPPLTMTLISLFVTFVISFALIHVWSLIVEGLLAAQGIACDRLLAVKITILSSSPWFLIFAFFPYLHEGILLGAFWVVTLLPVSYRVLAQTPHNKIFRLSAGTSLLWMATYLFSNLFFIGILSVAGG